MKEIFFFFISLFSSGHAFEARVYAEDPNKNFIPQTGKIRHVRLPTGEGVTQLNLFSFLSDFSQVRVDTGIRNGDSVTPYYDPMISKLIVWDVNRTEALRKLHRALEGEKETALFHFVLLSHSFRCANRI